jgi:hypothetical protein
MLFSLGAWCPSKGKGKGGRAPSNGLYSYSIYVLESGRLGVL